MGEVVNQGDTDYLTGLLNRRGFVRRFEQLPPDEHITVVSFDLDNFKTVNDVYGHDTGDFVLLRVSELLSRLTDFDFAARMGGDEFVLVSSTLLERTQVDELMRRFFDDVESQQGANEPFSIITLSAGILLDIPVSVGIESILNWSDIAMYQAKRNGKNRFVFYEDIDENVRMENEMVNSVIEALDKGNFDVMMHPLFSMSTRKPLQIEAHFVWRFAEGKNYYASQFRKVLERNGFIRTVDLRLFELLCQKLAKNRDKLADMPRFSLLVSMQSMYDEKLCQKFTAIVEKYGLSTQMFDLAVSEDFFDRRASLTLIKRMNELVSRGFTSSLIAFGSNFYSVKYVRKLPITVLKIYPPYLKQLLSGDERDRKILQTIIDSARSLVPYVSGGELDDIQQAVDLYRMGCDCCEGEAIVAVTTIDGYENAIETGFQRLEEALSPIRR